MAAYGDKKTNPAVYSQLGTTYDDDPPSYMDLASINMPNNDDMELGARQAIRQPDSSWNWTGPTWTSGTWTGGTWTGGTWTSGTWTGGDCTLTFPRVLWRHTIAIIFIFLICIVLYIFFYTFRGN